MNLLKYKHFYLIGIKGVGMTMLAQFLKKLGKDVSGSDISDVFMTDRILKEEGIKVFKGFKAERIPKEAVIIYSSAYSSENNVEVKAAQLFKKALVVNYAQAIGSVFSHYKGIAVCGSHGKTTTSAWLGFVLEKLGLSPNVLVGAVVPQLGGSALLGKSDYFIAEADEYQNKLQYFLPHGIILNNIEYDHPDFFKTKASYYQVFADFVAKLKVNGFLVANYEDREIRKLLSLTKSKIITYAISDNLGKDVKQVSLLAHSLHQDDKFQYFKVNDLGEFKIRLFGRHNVLNALAVLASALALGIEPQEAKSALALFEGTARRAQLLGEYRGVKIFDDYGHHPTEIKATIRAFRERYKNNRLVVLFHPHTYTRTKALFKDFLTSFDEADILGVLSIYGSAREKQGGISSLELVNEISKRKIKQVKYLADFNQASDWLKKDLKKGDILVLLGAGDVFRVGEMLLKK